MINKFIGRRLAILPHNRHSGFVLLIPLLLLFFILALMELWMLEVSQQLKFQQLREMRVKYDIYITSHLTEAVEISRELKVNERRYFLSGAGENEVYIQSEDKGAKEKTVVWLINFDGISNQSSFIMEMDESNFIKWKYR